MLEPIQASEWGYDTAAHLLNRAGFGGTPDHIATLRDLGPEGAVDRLLGFRSVEEVEDVPAWARPDPERVERQMKMRKATAEERAAFRKEEQAMQRKQVLELRHGWIRRMTETHRPLQEKMVLFWHGHFATSIQKVRDPWLMYRQLATFREHATGNWPELLMAVTRDPAMLIWLDQAQSRREHPNENYAREVLELFALGEGNYTEKDVLETARALTGLGYDRARQEPQWRPRLHDPGAKTVLGYTGPLNPEGVIRRIAEHPASARFMARRLWEFLAADEPAERLVAALAERFEAGGRRFAPLLRAILLSREFHAPEVRRTQIKSPVQWLVMALRQLERPVPRAESVTGALRDLGQELLAPPNVKGWDGGVAWINTGTWTRRQQHAALLVDGLGAVPDVGGGERGERIRARLRRQGGGMRMSGGEGRSTGGVGVERLFTAGERGDRERLLAALQQRFLQAPFRPSLRAEVREALGDDRVPDPRAVREAVRVVLQSTDYQLC